MVQLKATIEKGIQLVKNCLMRWCGKTGRHDVLDAHKMEHRASSDMLRVRARAPKEPLEHDQVFQNRVPEGGTSTEKTHCRERIPRRASVDTDARIKSRQAYATEDCLGCRAAVHSGRTRCQVCFPSTKTCSSVPKDFAINGEELHVGLDEGVNVQEPLVCAQVRAPNEPGEQDKIFLSVVPQSETETEKTHVKERIPRKSPVQPDARVRRRHDHKTQDCSGCRKAVQTGRKRSLVCVPSKETCSSVPEGFAIGVDGLHAGLDGRVSAQERLDLIRDGQMREPAVIANSNLNAEDKRPCTVERNIFGGDINHEQQQARGKPEDVLTAQQHHVRAVRRISRPYTQLKMHRNQRQSNRHRAHMHSQPSDDLMCNHQRPSIPLQAEGRAVDQEKHVKRMQEVQSRIQGEQTDLTVQKEHMDFLAQLSLEENLEKPRKVRPSNNQLTYTHSKPEDRLTSHQEHLRPYQWQMPQSDQVGQGKQSYPLTHQQHDQQPETERSRQQDNHQPVDALSQSIRIADLSSVAEQVGIPQVLPQIDQVTQCKHENPLTHQQYEQHAEIERIRQQGNHRAVNVLSKMIRAADLSSVVEQRGTSQGLPQNGQVSQGKHENPFTHQQHDQQSEIERNRQQGNHQPVDVLSQNIRTADVSSIVERMDTPQGLPQTDQVSQGKQADPLTHDQQDQHSETEQNRQQENHGPPTTIRSSDVSIVGKNLGMVATVSDPPRGRGSHRLRVQKALVESSAHDVRDALARSAPVADTLEEQSFAQRLCTICWEREAKTRFQPCGHSIACKKCAARIQSQVEFPKCPFCRADIEYYNVGKFQKTFDGMTPECSNQRRWQVAFANLRRMRARQR